MNVQEIKNIILITIGSIFLASGVVFFLYPAKIITGGTPGLGLLSHYLTGISIGKAMLAINIPLLLIGRKYLQTGFALRTVYSMIVTSVVVDALIYYVDFPAIQSLLLATLYGGVSVGVGIGLVLKANASAGGTTIIARIIASKTQLKPGLVIMLLDAMIIISVGVIFKNFEGVLWSIITIYVAAIVIDKIVTGGVSEKLVNIVSEKTDEICQAIRSDLRRDGTIVEGQNLSRKHDKSIIFVVVNVRNIPMLRELVLRIDNDALMIIMEASEMVGTSRRYH
ncbi:MAG TPA: YitT family protein [Oceanospirillales bacterium]|nr:YitT family protein [Oceanospirillales bacterium]